ncbi:MAG: ATP synthase subunit C [Clostridiaceae bacterium]
MLYLLIITLVVVIATISYGLVVKAKEDVNGEKKLRKAFKINLASFVPAMTFAIIMMIPNIVNAATTTGASSAAGLGYLAAAISTGLATIGAGYAVGAVGSSALGAVSENPKILGKTLIYVGLAEGIAIYGMIISIMILGRL